MNVLANSDNVVNIGLGKPTVALLNSHGVNATFHEIDTRYGHTGPMLDAVKWANTLSKFLASTP